MKVLLIYKDTLSEYTFNRIYKEPLNRICTAEFYKASLPFNERRVSITKQRAWLEKAKDQLDEFDYIIVSYGELFKTMTRTKKTESNIGNIFSSKYTTANVLYIPSHLSYNFNPNNTSEQISKTFKSIYDHSRGNYKKIGDGILNKVKILHDADDIGDALEEYLNEPIIFVDIETYDLNITKAGIASIAIAKNTEEAISFAVYEHENIEVRYYVKDFFKEYTGKIVYHKANFDACIMIYEFFIKDSSTNYNSIKKGLVTFLNNFEDTLLISYLATNNCSGNQLSLKQLAQPFAGNWGIDVSDITKLNRQELLEYNAIDALSTAWVYEQYYPKMIEEDQKKLYKKFMKPTLVNIVRMQLVGMPIDMHEVFNLKEKLTKRQEELTEFLRQQAPIKNTEWILAEREAEIYNKNHKVKQKEALELIKPMNLNSGAQLSILLFDVMNLPILNLTPTNKPSTSSADIKELLNHTDNKKYKEILEAILGINEVSKILNTFIPAFESAHKNSEGDYTLHGYFNTGGTISGRLSSNSPNLQQIPSTGTKLAKDVKKVFKAPDGWLIAGIDFNALEDRISALTTKDKNKLKVYTDNLDGHCLRAYTYWKDKMPDIDPNSVESINSIKNKYPELRQASKTASFALTYGGGVNTLIKNSGFTREEAQRIFDSYHELYKESDEWVQEHIKKACEVGYITTGFGLKVRTPVLKNTIYSKNMGSIASAEARTAGNALGQGWGVLNDRARNEVLAKVDASQYRADIFPIAAIHDANYYLIRNDIDVVLWFNQVVVEACRWQDHPVISHPEVGLEGNLSLFYPTWADEIVLPQHVSRQGLRDLIEDYLESINKE